MKVRELMSSPAHTCRTQDSLESAARLLWDHDIGMLPVIDSEGRICAAITDRDICMSAFTSGRRLADVKVADAMSKDAVTCRADDDVGAVVERMIARQLHRLPVVDAELRPCGVVSLNDLAVVSDEDPRLRRDALKALRGVCRHRSRVPAEIVRSTSEAGSAQVRSSATW